jgi:hypothetical protein
VKAPKVVYAVLNDSVYGTEFETSRAAALKNAAAWRRAGWKAAVVEYVPRKTRTRSTP